MIMKRPELHFAERVVPVPCNYRDAAERVSIYKERFPILIKLDANPRVAAQEQIRNC
jgi:hypothetical protein